MTFKIGDEIWDENDKLGDYNPLVITEVFEQQGHYKIRYISLHNGYSSYGDLAYYKKYYKILRPMEKVLYVGARKL
jgi:hypothetical protein